MLKPKHEAVMRKAAAVVRARGHEGDARLADSLLGVVASLSQPLPAEQPSNPVADRAARQPVAGSVGTPQFRAVLSIYNQGRMTENDFICHINTHINALIAPAAPSIADQIKQLQASIENEASMQERCAWLDILREILSAPAAPSGEAVLQVSTSPSGVWADVDQETFDMYQDYGAYRRRILYTHPAPRDVDAPIVLPEKPKSNLITETSGPDPMCSYIDTAYTGDQMDAHATAAVQKDRVNWKESK